MNRTIGALLAEGAETLARAELTAASPRLEAELLLAEVLGTGRATLFAYPERRVADDDVGDFRVLVDRRRRGEPLAYLLGRREFWSLDLEVTPDVLIPRPETELLVELALECVPMPGTGARLADLGTGSGAIALAVARERPAATVHATDRSAAALAVAGRNARRLGLERIRFHPGDWCEPLADLGFRFDLLLSNPPYVREGDPHLERGDCRFEPRQALTPGVDDLASFRCLTKCAGPILRPGGWLMLEHGPEQGSAVRRLLASRGYREIATHRDLAGHERITIGRRPEPAP